MGSRFNYDNTVLEVVKADSPCNKCYFYDGIRCTNHDYNCSSHDRSDNNNVIFKSVNEERNRSVNISLNDAKELYKLGGRMKELALSAYSEYDINPIIFPSSWDELLNLQGYDIAEELINKVNTINKVMGDKYSLFYKLIILRDVYNNGWKPDYNSDGIKYSIKLSKGSLVKSSTYRVSELLVFSSESVRDKFLENFHDMIIKVGDLI